MDQPAPTSVKVLKEENGISVIELQLGIREERCQIDENIYLPTRKEINARFAGNLYRYLNQRCSSFRPVLTSRPQRFKLKSASDIDEAEIERIVSSHNGHRPAIDRNTLYYEPTKIHLIGPTMVRINVGLARQTMFLSGAVSPTDVVETCVRVKESSMGALYDVLRDVVEAFNVELKTGWQYIKFRKGFDLGELAERIQKLEGEDFVILKQSGGSLR